jgi:integrase
MPTRRASGRRTIELDAATVAVLREHRKRQAQERLLIGAGWKAHGLGFAASTAARRIQGISPARSSGTSAASGCGGPAARHASQLGHARVGRRAASERLVQERLGHANISITMDTYSHVTASLHSQAAEQVAALIFGGGETVG